MDISKLYWSPQDDYLLTNGNWQKADFYSLETSSSFWNKAILITLQKEVAKTTAEALIYVLEKQAKSLGIWANEWTTKNPTVAEFIAFFIAQKGFTNIIGKKISAETFYDNYLETINGITAEPSFEFLKNDKLEVYENLLDPETILNIICFDDDWQEQNYFIETETNWVLYHWNAVE